MKNWDYYYRKTGKEPRTLLVEAVINVKNKNKALDLGAGNLRDTIYLIKKKFNYIDIVDKQIEIKKYAKKIDSKKICIHIISFDKFKFKEKYDLINAQYALPFIKKEKFYKLLYNIKKSLNKEGIFTGQFFGEKDDWKNRKNMTFISKQQAKKVFKGFNIIKFLEEEKDEITAIGEKKHWHVFHFIAKKI